MAGISYPTPREQVDALVAAATALSPAGSEEVSAEISLLGSAASALVPVDRDLAISLARLAYDKAMSI